jgi:ABC-type phosphate transport system auxiliary subunit
MAAKLKVFVTSDGLTDYVVATTSRPKALAAWGAHQDLFKTGLARETDDAALREAATAQPGEVLRRAAGTRETLAKMKPVKRAPEKPKGPSKAALKRIASAERRLSAAEDAHAEAVAALDAERARLDARWDKDRARLQAALRAARQALA